MWRLVGALCLVGTVQGSLRAHAQLVEATVSVDSVHVGERFLLTVSALHGFADAAAFSSLQEGNASLGDLDDISVASTGSIMLDADTRLDSIVYDVTTFALDSAVVPPITVRMDGGMRPDSTRRLVIPVISVVPADADTIRAMAEPVGFLEPGRRRIPPWPWVVLGLAVLIAIGGVIYALTRKRTVVVGDESPDPSLPPYEVAMGRLQALQNTDLAKNNSEEPYYVELSEALRMYLEERIDIPALELTTVEVLDQLPRIRHKIPGGIPDDLRRVLGLSDLVKFAEYVPPIPESQQALEEAIGIVERLEAKQRQLELDATRQEEIKR